MKKLLENIVAFTSVLLFFYFAAGFSDIIISNDKKEEVCRLQKKCECCSSEKKSGCCSDEVTAGSAMFSLPCSHPGFHGKDFHLDPADIGFEKAALLKISYPEYIITDSDNPSRPESFPLLKPPCYI